MKLHQLKRSKGLKNKPVQRGRGNASGRGNYSGRGMKGQNARSGGGVPIFFEGGQTPLIQRMPKRKGFKRPFKLIKDVAVINLGTLDQDKRIDNTMEISKAKLKELGYIKNISIAVKILGDGDYNKKLTFKDIDVFSKSAQAKLDKPGSSKTGKLKLKSIKEQQSEKMKSEKGKVKKVVKKVKKPQASSLKPQEKKKVVKKTPVKKTIPKAAKKPAKVKETPLLEVEEAKPKKASPKKVTK